MIACAIDTNGVVREPYVQVSAGTAFDRCGARGRSSIAVQTSENDGEPVMETLMDISINFRVTG